MSKQDNIIKFYIIAHNLKDKLRTGFVEIGITKDRIESVAEHIYGTLILAIGIDSEYQLDLDMYKVLKMLILHETEETLMPDFTVRSDITPEQKIDLGKEMVFKATEGLFKQKEIEDLLNEFNAHESNESKFCYHIDKIECDFQAKMYELEGVMHYDKAREDLPFYGDRADEIDKKAKTASDFWIEYDKPRYQDDEIFKSLIESIQQIKKIND